MTRTKTILAAAGSALVAAALIVGPSAFAANSIAAPELVSPANGATLTSAQWDKADWSDVSVNASSTPVSYYYESSNSSTTNSDGSFASAAYTSGALSDSQISTMGTGEGTYFWHVRAQDSMGSSSPWSSTYMVTVTNETGTSTPPGSAQALIDKLQALQDDFPSYYWNLQWLINDLMDTDGGTSTPPSSGGAMIDNASMTVMHGGAVDFTGRNFGHEQTVTITSGGSTVGHAHADGGGNFSTGSMQAPGTAGTYVYTFTDESGHSATATLTVH